MANQRIDDAPGGALATLLAADFFLVQKQSDDTDYSVTPAVLMNYMETGMIMTGSGVGSCTTIGVGAGCGLVMIGAYVESGFSICCVDSGPLVLAVAPCAASDNGTSVSVDGSLSVVCSSASSLEAATKSGISILTVAPSEALTVI